MHKLDSVQLMRAVAAVMVLIGHVIAEAEYYMDLTIQAGQLPWTRGVDIFFIISGFIIALSGRRYFGQPGGTRAFVIRRFIRVVPLYWLFTTLMLLALILLPSGVKDTPFDPAQIASSYAFWPYARADGRVAPILSLGWTLNYEIFFYIIFSACLTVRHPSGMVLVVGIIATLSLAGWAFDPQTPALAVWTNSILIEFGLGILLAEVWLSQRGRLKHSVLKGSLILITGFALLIALNQDGMSPIPRFIASGIPALLIVAGPILYWQRDLPRLTTLLGDSSYALYLSHRFVLRGVTLVALPVLPATMTGAAVYLIGVCGLAIITGVLVFRYIETPMLRALNKRILSAPAAAQPA